LTATGIKKQVASYGDYRTHRVTT